MIIGENNNNTLVTFAGKLVGNVAVFFVADLPVRTDAGDLPVLFFLVIDIEQGAVLALMIHL